MAISTAQPESLVIVIGDQALVSVMLDTSELIVQSVPIHILASARIVFQRNFAPMIAVVVVFVILVLVRVLVCRIVTARAVKSCCAQFTAICATHVLKKSALNAPPVTTSPAESGKCAAVATTLTLGVPAALWRKAAPSVRTPP